MTQIDFHTDVPDKLDYTCRLIRKARQKDVKIVVYHDDAQSLQQLDDALWTFSEADFLPHVMADDALAAQTPIILTSAAPDDQLPHFDVLLNLSLHAPDAFTRFTRMIEIVADNDGERLAARARYANYKQQAHPLTHISLKNSRKK